jgi:hypothetical protein
VGGAGYTHAPVSDPDPGRLVGIDGRPYHDLEAHLDLPPLDLIDDEVCLGLTEVTPEYTGGSLKWMGVCAPSVMADGYIDYGQLIPTLDDEAFVRFLSLGDNPRAFDLRKRHVYRFGDETANPLTAAQARYLEIRHGVYFPWKVAYHLLDNDAWEDKHDGAGKSFRDEARERFPLTVAMIEALPFREIGRALIFGLAPHDHAPRHRDTTPDRSAEVGHTITICPRGDKGFYLCSPDEQHVTPVTARAYWFNDMDYHGVAAHPRFRYSIRVDGVFDPAFRERLRQAR